MSSESLQIRLPSSARPSTPARPADRNVANRQPVSRRVPNQFLFALFKLKSLLSLATFLAFYWALYGAKFGVGFALLILVHEMGHYIDWAAMGVSPATQAAVSLAGSRAGLIGAAVCGLLWSKIGYGLWAALARAFAVLNIRNLTPVGVLDGGKAMSALAKSERFVVLCAAVARFLLVGEGIFLLVAAGAAYRLFTKDLPQRVTVR